MQPSISVVIPTHNRSTVVRRTLMSLAHQTVPAEQFEVILVADGCEDDTAAMAQVLEVPYRLTILAQGASGAAAARNLGAGAAAAALLMFLDDDMEALPGLIEAHLAAHHERPDTVVLGYFPVVPTEGPSDFYRVTSRAWWEDMFTRQARPNYRFTFRDLCAGNISLSREQFFNAGGFDPQFKGMSGEDYELGVRLLRAGARFSFVRAATSLHHDASTQARSCQRALADGRGQVVLLRKHPELVTELSLGFPVTKPFQLLIYQLV